jgi:hypothetical protein
MSEQCMALGVGLVLALGALAYLIWVCRRQRTKIDEQRLVINAKEKIRKYHELKNLPGRFDIYGVFLDEESNRVLWVHHEVYGMYLVYDFPQESEGKHTIGESFSVADDDNRNIGDMSTVG